VSLGPLDVPVLPASGRPRLRARAAGGERPPAGLPGAQAIDERGDVLWCGAAAAADEREPELAGEPVVGVGELVRAQRVVRAVGGQHGEAGVRKELMADLETAPEDHQESRKSIFTHFWKSYGNPFLRALRTICAVLCGAVVFTLTVWLLQGVFASVAAVFGHGRGYTPWETGLAELLLGIVVSMACRFVAPGKHAEQEFSEKLVFYGEHWFMPSRAPTGKELRATVHEVYDEARKGVLPLGKVNEEVAFRIRVRTCQTFEGACRENDLNNRKRTLAFYVFTFSAGMLGFLLEFSVYVRTALHAVDRSLLEAVTRFI